MSYRLKKLITQLTGTFAPRRGIAIASYPRSGNTWVRKLVEDISGEQTGSIYQDKVMPRGRDGIVIKTHKRDSERYAAAIFIVRNPFDSLYSSYRYESDIANLAPGDADAFMLTEAAAWQAHFNHWYAAPIRKLVIRYEDLLEDTPHCLFQVCAFIGLTPDAGRIREVCEANTIEALRGTTDLGARFFRSGQVGEGLRACTPETLDRISKKLAAEIDILQASPATLRARFNIPEE